jgi:TPR repeat protein
MDCWRTKPAVSAAPWAREKLATSYRDSTGVAKDEQRAVELFQKSAEKGDTYSETSLAFMYAALLSHALISGPRPEKFP